MRKPQKQASVPARRRVFTAEFKQEMVRQFEDRRAQGVSQAQIARELDLSVPMLQSWAREVARQPDAAASAVFPGPGRQPSEQEELRRLQREVQRLQQENSFLKAAAAYFAKTSR